MSRYERLCLRALKLQQRAEKLSMRAELARKRAASEAKWSSIATMVPR